jgi:hypothetical protein
MPGMAREAHLRRRASLFAFGLEAGLGTMTNDFHYIGYRDRYGANRPLAEQEVTRR